MVPAFLDGDARGAARNDEAADQRFGIVGARPDGEPAQGEAAGRVDFAPGQPKAALDAAGERRRQAAAAWRAQFRLDQQRVAERAVRHGRTRDLFFERRRKGRIAQHAEMEKILLRQHEGRRGFARADGVDDMVGRGARSPPPPPSATGTTRARSPASFSSAMFSKGKDPASSCSAARRAKSRASASIFERSSGESAHGAERSSAPVRSPSVWPPAAIACAPAADARQHRQGEALGDQPQNGRGVVERMIDEAFFAKGETISAGMRVPGPKRSPFGGAA